MDVVRTTISIHSQIWGLASMTMKSSVVWECNAVQSTENLSTFWRNISSLSSFITEQVRQGMGWLWIYATFIEFTNAAFQALEDVHLPQRPIVQDILYYMDRIFTVVFFIEMLIKWLALGFKKYFTNAWCWLDFVIVMVSPLFEVYFLRVV
jgi:hypothetical protein